MVLFRVGFVVTVIVLMIAYLKLGVEQDLTNQNGDNAVSMAMLKMSPAFLFGTWNVFAAVFSPAFAASVPPKGTTRAAGWYSLLVGFGLIMGAVGDACLEMEKVKEEAFVFGLVAFLVGHLMYIVAFLVTGMDAPLGKTLLSCSVFGSLAALLLWILLPKVQEQKDGVLVIPVLVYAVTLAGMAIVASLWRGEGAVVPAAENKAVTATATRSSSAPPPSAYAGVVSSRAWTCAFAGAVMFLISDSILAINKFAIPFENARAATMITYYLAQTLFEVSAYFLRSASDSAFVIAKSQ